MGQKTHPKGFRLITTQTHLSSWYKEKLSYRSCLEEDHEIRVAIEKELKDFVPASLVEIARVTSPGEKVEQVEILVSALFPAEREMAKRLTILTIESTQAEETKKTAADSSPETEMPPEEKEEKMAIERERVLEEDEKSEEEENSLEIPSLKDTANAVIHEKLRSVVAHFQKTTNKAYKVQMSLIENQFEDARLIARCVAEQLVQRIPFRRTLKQVIQKVHQTSGKGIKIEISGRLNGADIARSEWKREGKVPLHTLNTKIDYTHQIAQTTAGTLGIKVWLFTP